MYRTAISGAARMLPLAILIGVTGCQAEAPAASPGKLDTSLPMLELMVHVVQPAADRFWKGAGTISNKDGVRDLRPTTPEGWKSVEDGAISTLEVANLLMLGDRPREPVADWTRHVEQLREASREAVAAVERRAGDDEMLEISARIYEACQACHEQFTNPETQQTAAPAKP